MYDLCIDFLFHIQAVNSLDPASFLRTEWIKRMSVRDHIIGSLYLSPTNT